MPSGEIREAIENVRQAKARVVVMTTVGVDDYEDVDLYMDAVDELLKRLENDRA